MSAKRDWSTMVMLILIGIILALLFSALAEGQEAPPQREQLVALVARVSFNEAGDSYADAALIWQVVEGHGETDRERIRWLEQHSPCVSGRFTQDEAQRRPGNCRWTRNLTRAAHTPRGWPYSADHWRHRVRSRWLAHITVVRDFVEGRDAYRPCDETPTSWDGRTWAERWPARGYREVACGGDAQNAGLVRAADGPA